MNTNGLSQKEMLLKELAKIEEKLDKTRTSVLEDGWQTMRHAKKSRKWDYYAQRKREIQDQLEELEVVK
ncbi:MAG TPA: hypothetical protein VN922_14310 [Bacteroidia bacterium]|nr:hypothetical protein [Bacteroidia bacterium]